MTVRVDNVTQAIKAAELARDAFATGDLVTGIAASTLAAQLLQLAKIWTPPHQPLQRHFR